MRSSQTGSTLTLSGGPLNLAPPVTLEKCSRHWRRQVRKSLTLRLTGTVVRTADGGYVASFGPHDSPLQLRSADLAACRPSGRRTPALCGLVRHLRLVGGPMIPRRCPGDAPPPPAPDG